MRRDSRVRGMRLLLRAARPQDAVEAATLLYSTGPSAFNLVFGSEAKAVSIITRLFQRPGNPMSFEYATVAEFNTRVAGILILLDPRTEKRSQPRMGAELVRICGPLYMLFRLPTFVRLGRMTSQASADELSVADVAVSPAMQGLGIGRLLMERAQDRARAEGYRMLSLYVLADNSRAIGFYRRLGYRIREHMFNPWLARRWGFPGLFRMTKPVQVVHNKFQ